MAGDRQRYQVRHMIARMLEEIFFEGTATGYNTTTLTDTNELVNWDDSRLVDAFVYLYSATTNADQERRITANVQATGVITVPTWTLPTGTVKYEIHKQLRVKDINEMIDLAVMNRTGAGGALIPRVADTSLTITNNGLAASYYYTIPTGFRWIEQVLYESDVSGVYDFPVPRAAWANPDNIEKTTAATSSADSVSQLRIDRNRWAMPVTGRKLRIIGGGWQPLLTSDTDLLAFGLVPYVTHMAAYYLAGPMLAKGQGPEAEQRRKDAQDFLRIAMSQAASPSLYHAPPGAVPVRS